MDSQIGYNTASTRNSHLAYSRLPFPRRGLHGAPKGLGQPKLALGTSPQHVASFIKTVVAMQLVTSLTFVKVGSGHGEFCQRGLSADLSCDVM